MTLCRDILDQSFLNGSSEQHCCSFLCCCLLYWDICRALSTKNMANIPKKCFSFHISYRYHVFFFSIKNFVCISLSTPNECTLFSFVNFVTDFWFSDFPVPHFKFWSESSPTPFLPISIPILWMWVLCNAVTQYPLIVFLWCTLVLSFLKFIHLLIFLLVSLPFFVSAEEFIWT